MKSLEIWSNSENTIYDEEISCVHLQETNNKMNNAVTRDIYPYLDKRWFNLIQVWYLTSGALSPVKRNINKERKI